MLILLHSVIDRKSMKSTSAYHNGNKEDLLVTVLRDLLSKIYYQYVTMERQMGHSASFSAVSNILQTMDGVRNTSAITVVTKSSMKP